MSSPEGNFGSSLSSVLQRALIRAPGATASEERALTVARDGMARRLAEQVGTRYHWTRASLDTFSLAGQGHVAKLAVLNQLRGLDLGKMIEEGRGLVFFGPVGTGKDHLAIALMYDVIRKLGHPCQWINGQDWFGTIRDRMDQGKAENDMMQELARPKVLTISDPIPARRDPSPFNLEMLFRLVDRRYRNMGSTWMTLNVATPKEADVRLSAPVFDRIKEQAVMVRCFWSSYRERK